MLLAYCLGDPPAASAIDPLQSCLQCFNPTYSWVTFKSVLCLVHASCAHLLISVAVHLASFICYIEHLALCALCTLLSTSSDLPQINDRLAEALEMDEGGGGGADAGGAPDSYYGDGGYEDEKMRQVNNFAVPGVRQNLLQDSSSVPTPS